MKKVIALFGIVFGSVVFADAPALQSGDIVRIGDFDYVVMSKSDFDRMVLTVDDLKAKWTVMNSNETGRAALHGRRGHTTITNGTIMVEYADGYKHIEAVKQNAVKRDRAHFNRPADRSTHALKMERIRARRKAALAHTNEVTEVVK